MNGMEFALRILAALVLGAGIGIERQWRQRLAGLRTNALVSVGAAAFVALAAMVTNEDSPTRIAAQVVSGIGFLGAGVIFREGATVRGINTAATLWCSAAVGVLAGSGFYAPAAMTAAIVLEAHLLLRPLARTIDRQPVEAVDEEVHYLVNATCLEADEQRFRGLLLQGLSQAGLPLRRLSSRDTGDPGCVLVRAEVIAEGRQDKLIEQVASRLGLEPGLSAVGWMIAGQAEAGAEHAPGPRSALLLRSRRARLFRALQSSVKVWDNGQTWSLSMFDADYWNALKT